MGPHLLTPIRCRGSCLQGTVLQAHNLDRFEAHNIDSVWVLTYLRSFAAMEASCQALSSRLITLTLSRLITLIFSRLITLTVCGCPPVCAHSLPWKLPTGYCPPNSVRYRFWPKLDQSTTHTHTSVGNKVIQIKSCEIPADTGVLVPARFLWSRYFDAKKAKIIFFLLDLIWPLILADTGALMPVQLLREIRAGCICPQPVSTRNPKPEALNPQPSTLNPQPETLNPEPSTLNLRPET